MGTTYKELFKLYDLIQNGDARSVRHFLTETSTEINVILPSKGIGVLHLAVGVDPVEKSNECTEALLKYGGDPNLCNEDGVTPVHIAAIWGRVDNLRILIGCGGDPSLRDLDGLSAFDYAARDQQWNVYDYLHNVIDNNADDDKCSFTLELDKILVNTDQMVAEYRPADEVNTTQRKSTTIRDWREINSLVVNKLYPTILSETYLLDDETNPFKDTNITLDLTTHTETSDNSFKTCLSNKTTEISGVHPLDQTTDTRKSVYENFSLPGSPKTITHRNYNSKTNLRNKSKESLSVELKKLSLNSLISSDCSLDKAMAVVQNRTNEWLSDEKCNTRRSSASSGVSSNYSGGSIILADVHEEYKYEDKEEKVVLIEKRLRVSPIILPVEETADGSPDQTIVSIASSLPTALSYDDESLRAALVSRGCVPGPINSFTRTVYLRKLQTLAKSPTVEPSSSGKSYSIELEKSLRSDEWMNDLSKYIELENKVRTNFNDDDRTRKQGNAKTHFTYLLLDPRLTDNLPAKQGVQTKQQMWNSFINSIFYIGKGSRSRPYAHLYEALSLWKRGFKETNNKKVQQILNIWNDNVGVVCLHIFQNVKSVEAHTYEAAMIDVIGLTNLKNIINGTYYGIASSWPHKERRMLGLYLLYKAMNIFIYEGERQLRPGDVREK